MANDTSASGFIDTSAAAARSTRQARLAAARLYVCTDARRDARELERFLHAAYAGGADVIQLRDKSLEASDEIAALRVLARVAAENDALFAVNDRADIAALVGADIVHVGQRDLAPAQVRRLLGADVLIGRSTHQLDQSRAALAHGDVDYLTTGPVWPTPTKPGREATGLGFVGSVTDMIREEADGERATPRFAIGGIDAQRLPQVLAAGADRIVVVRAITEAADPAAAARQLRDLLPG